MNKLTNNKPLFIGIIGGSGAGKTYLCRELIKKLGSDQATHIQVDLYMYPEAKTNNKPEAIDFDSLHKELELLISGQEIVERKSHNILKPSGIYLIEGHLLKYDPKLYEMFDLTMFIDLDKEERLLRRIERNVGYGWDLKGVIDWYRKDVKENYDNYVEPCKKDCDLILWGELNTKKIELLALLIQSLKMKKENINN